MNAHRPSLILAIVLSLGIMVGTFTGIFFIWAALLLIGTVWAFFDQRPWPIYIAVFSLGAVLVLNMDRLSSDSIARISYDDRQDIRMTEGIVDSNPHTSNSLQGQQTIFNLKVKKILTQQGWMKQGGKIQVHLYRNLPIHYGQYLRLSGHWSGMYVRQPGMFWAIHVGKKSSIEILAENKGNWFVAASLKIQKKFKDVFEHYLDHEEAGMIIAMVLGERSSMPKEMQTAFINTGTAHIIAISGMNMAIITTIVFFLLKCIGLPRLGQFLVTSIFLFSYGFLTGLSASVVRACIMSSVILMSFAFELEGEALNSLGVAAGILLLINPKNLFDIGFQLSFAAVLAILLLYKHCLKLFFWLPEILAKALAVSLAAWIGTAPLIFIHFRMITPISIIANIPIVPLADLTVALGLGLGVTGLFCDPLANAFAGCLKLVFNLMVLLANWFNQIPFGHFNFN